MPPPSRRLRVQLPRPLFEALRAEAKARKLPIGELVRLAVRADLRRPRADGVRGRCSQPLERRVNAAGQPPR
jgi:hypothetical protein